MNHHRLPPLFYRLTEGRGLAKAPAVSERADEGAHHLGPVDAGEDGLLFLHVLAGLAEMVELGEVC